jgi:hypothetical protein
MRFACEAEAGDVVEITVHNFSKTDEVFFVLLTQEEYDLRQERQTVGPVAATATPTDPTARFLIPTLGRWVVVAGFHKDSLPLPLDEVQRIVTAARIARDGQVQTLTPIPIGEPHEIG